jgi:hypothetical protein
MSGCANGIGVGMVVLFAIFDFQFAIAGRGHFSDHVSPSSIANPKLKIANLLSFP